MSATVIAAASLAASSSNSRKLEEELCKVVMEKFEPKTSTVQEIQEYAKCVDIIYPTAISPEAMLFWKIIFVISLCGMLLGFYKAHRTDYKSGDEYFVYPLLGFVLAAVLALFFSGVIAGIFWLFN